MNKQLLNRDHLPRFVHISDMLNGKGSPVLKRA